MFRSPSQALGVVSLLAALAGTRAMHAQPANRLDGGRLSIAVVDQPYGLDLALLELSRFCACVIAHEEPEWAWRGDLETVRGARGEHLPVVRRTTLRVTASVSDPMTQDDTRRVVTQLVAQFERQTTARFTIRGDWPLEVVPTQSRAADGSVRRIVPLIDTPISIAGPPALPAVWLQRTAAALAVAARRDVKPVLQGHQVTFGAVTAFEARDEPASAVIRRLYGPAQPAAGWSLSYMPFNRSSSLALRTPRPRHLSVIDPDPPGGAPER